MTEVANWKATAAANDITGPPDFPKEGWGFNEVNDWAREAMAAVRRWYADPEFLNLNYGLTITRLSTTQFKVVGIDGTTWFTANRRVKIVGATTDYGYVESSSYAAGDTTVTVTMDLADVPASPTQALVHASKTLNRTAFSGQIPTGALIPWSGAIAQIPSGYLLCNGAEVLKATYPALWAAFGSAHLYGASSNPTTLFKLPDMGGRTFIGYVSGGDGDGDYGTIGGTYGTKKHALAAAEAPAINDHPGHQHSIAVAPTASAYAGGSTPAAQAHDHGGNTGANAAQTHAYGASGTAHENRQPSVVGAWIVKT